VDWIPFPPDYRIVLANSLKKAEKSGGAKDVFNQRVACYAFALMLVRRNSPRYAPQLEHLRDLNPRRLGVDEAAVYRMIRSLPESARRGEILKMLPDQTERLRHVFGSHAEPQDGYRIRQVCLYGVSECVRSQMAADMLRKGDVRGFGELISISHDGDRVTRLQNGRRVPHDNRCADERIDALIADLASGEPQRQERARLWRQPGGYDVSTEELDSLVDIARASPGVVGAGLVGAGLGGSVVAIVEAAEARRLVENLVRDYYQPRKLTPAASVIRPVGGAGLGLALDGSGAAS
jgi:galactokinase